MNLDEIIEMLKKKIRSKEYSRVFANVLYRYYISKKDPISSLENVRFMGVGKVVATNYSLVNENHPLCWDFEDPNTYHFLILRNEQTKALCGLLIPPINEDNYIECKSFQYGFPVFDIVKDSKIEKGRIFFSNVFNEEVECIAYLFGSKIMFTDLLNDKQKELNKIIVEHNDKDSSPLLSTIIFNYMK